MVYTESMFKGLIHPKSLFSVSNICSLWLIIVIFSIIILVLLYRWSIHLNYHTVQMNLSTEILYLIELLLFTVKMSQPASVGWNLSTTDPDPLKLTQKYTH